MKLQVIDPREIRERWVKKPAPPNVDSAALERDLRSASDAEVRFDQTSRAIYSTDGSNYRQIPIGVVIPRSIDDVVTALEVCRRHQAPVLGRGCGTSLAGQCCNTAVVIDASKHLNRIVELDASKRIARVQPGVILDQLRDRAERDHRLTFGPDPATHSHCTLGGMIGNNSCGVHSVMAGRTVDNIEELEILTYNGVRMRVGPTSEEDLRRIVSEGGRRGEIHKQLSDLRDKYGDLIRQRYPAIPRRVSGYNLDELLPERGFNVARALVGSESTCAFTLEATVRLVASPEWRALVVFGYPDIYSAADHVPRILEHKPIGLEGIDDKLVGYMQRKELHPKDIGLLPEGDGWLLVEFGGGSREEADDKARRIMKELSCESDPPRVKLFADPAAEQQIWEIRESGLGATAYVPGMPDAWPGWEDAAVPPDRLSDYLRDFRGLLDEFGYDCALYGHFGDGCIHCRITFDLTSHQGVRDYMSFIERAADLVANYGGSYSGEHGDGQARAMLLPKLYGWELAEAFREFKSIWDPDGRMNPGKLVHPFAADENLRLGAGYSPSSPQTHFEFPKDGGDFAHATLRCVGVGKCRRTHDAFMCPSFIATRDEKDTTRGRARALFEMTQGQFITDGWKSEAVYDALDLCLGCKGCKKECPVDVDMATYKAEFLSHYYEEHRRPRTHWAMGLIQKWARIGAISPALSNFFAQKPPFASLTKAALGVDQRRRLPRFARYTFTKWFHSRKGRRNGPKVVLLPDAFNDYFFPDALRAAALALERWGYQVVLPDRPFPGIRPMIHYGMLGSAKRHLKDVVTDLSAHVREGTAVIGLEPSTVSVYREELPNLFPHDVDGQRLTENCFLFSEFVFQQNLPLPQLPRKAVFHGHCHQKAVLNADAAREVLRRMEIDFQEPEPGCCGMAGSFGYEAGEHHDVSITVAEQNLLPAVRRAGERALVIADGFSCREQIEQGTETRPRHLAEVVLQALEQVEQ